MKNYLIKLLVSIIISWVYDKSIKPIEDYVYGCIEDEGYFTYKECQKRSYFTLLRDLQKAKSILNLFNEDLPTTDETLIYCHRWRDVPAIGLIDYGSFYLYNKSKNIFSYIARVRHSYEKAIINKNIAIYDLVDDLKRDNYYLYEKRIKLYKIKELAGVEDYTDIKLPHVVPPEFMPDWGR